MKKIIVDLKPFDMPEKIQDYLKFILEFPDYYGGNLDALYDMLTENTEDTCIGLFYCDALEDSYLHKIIKVFQDAQLDNPHLIVIFGELADNFEEDEK